MTNNKLTDPEVAELRTQLQRALNFYRQRPEPEAAKMANMLMLADCAADELYKRRKADAELKGDWELLPSSEKTTCKRGGKTENHL